MGTIVTDPGHGGSQTVGGSSPNNATGQGGLKETAALAYLAAHQTVVSAIDATYASAKLAAPAPASPGRRGKRGRKARAAVSHECAAYVETKTIDEATAWGAQSAVALAAFAFWERFLGLGVQIRPGNPVPTREISGDERTRLLTILRAVLVFRSQPGSQGCLLESATRRSGGRNGLAERRAARCAR